MSQLHYGNSDSIPASNQLTQKFYNESILSCNNAELAQQKIGIQSYYHQINTQIEERLSVHPYLADPDVVMQLKTSILEDSERLSS